MKTITATRPFSFRRSLLARGAGSLLAIGVLGAVGVLAIAPAPAHAQVYVSVGIAPPVLPIYGQPMIPGDGYIWTPGYWAWGGSGYYWVPGSWMRPPFVGGLWTPGYWAWSNGSYQFRRGYWGRHVGFYGGINYGHGYGGHGYEGGYWRDGGFYYNRSVNRINYRVRNTYDKRVIDHRGSGHHQRTSYNGGPRGTNVRATPEQERWGRDRRADPRTRGYDRPERVRSQPNARTYETRPGAVRDGHPEARPSSAKPSDNRPRGINVTPRANKEERPSRGNDRGDRRPVMMQQHNRVNPQMDRNSKEHSDVRSSHEEGRARQAQTRQVQPQSRRGNDQPSQTARPAAGSTHRGDARVNTQRMNERPSEARPAQEHKQSSGTKNAGQSIEY